MLILSFQQIVFCSANVFVHIAFSSQESQSMTMAIS